MSKYIEKGAFRSLLVKRRDDLLWYEMNSLASTVNGVIKLLDVTPDEEVAPVIHARWEVCDYPEPDGHGFVNHYTKGVLVCTNCRYGWKRGKVVKNRYCPHCGAKMDKEDAPSD